jgi:hypothetical protein
MNYKMLINICCSGHEDRNILRRILESTKDFINEDMAEFYYCKNVLMDVNAVELYGITDDTIITVKLVEGNKVNIEKLYIKDVLAAILTRGLERCSSVALQLNFKNGRELFFDNYADTNEHWRDEYRKDIEKIYQKALNATSTS